MKPSSVATTGVLHKTHSSTWVRPFSAPYVPHPKGCVRHLFQTRLKERVSGSKAWRSFLDLLRRLDLLDSKQCWEPTVSSNCLYINWSRFVKLQGKPASCSLAPNTAVQQAVTRGLCQRLSVHHAASAAQAAVVTRDTCIAQCIACSN